MSKVARIEDFDGDYDPFTGQLVMGKEEMVTDLYGELQRRLVEGPVHDIDMRDMFGIPRDETLTTVRGVTVLGHDLVKTVLNDPATYSNTIYENFLGAAFGPSITTMDPPIHTHYRRIFQKAFLPGMIHKFKEDRVPKVINALVDRFADKGKAELVTSFTRYFAFNFINELLELPEEDRGVFHRLAVGQLAVSYDPPRGTEATKKLRSYLEQLVELRRDNPISDNDFIHIIATAEVDGERLPNDVVVAFFRQLMNAGGDTSYHGLGNILAGLLTNPSQLEEIRNNRELVPKAIEEGLRWECPVTTLFRNPTVPVTLGDVEVSTSDYLNVIIASANRDPRVWDRPNEFDIHREGRHLAFGTGAHICIGQHLARMEMVVAINILLDRLPNLRLDQNCPPPTIHGLILRGPDALNVEFDQ